MRFFADFHLHSHYSRATSRQLDLENLFVWAQLKGVRVVGTGDFVHPAWLQTLRSRLTEAEPGLFSLKKALQHPLLQRVPHACRAAVRFMLVTEISNIYKRGGKVRKVHNLIFAPSFSTARKIQKKLDAVGNIHSDGRPILGLDSRDLLYMVLETDPDAFLVPAHIWTPWFSLFGSKSGFDSLEECFGDLYTQIFAVETGLSSDPSMNRRLSQLDRCALISCSDAHSPSKLGREATVFSTSLNYHAIRSALREPEDEGLLGTVEFFAQEGKYYLDGHRKCGISLAPKQNRLDTPRCPVCGRPITVGVLGRVNALADRQENKPSPRERPYISLISLNDIIGQAIDLGSASRRVCRIAEHCYEKLGGELHMLKDLPLSQIEYAVGPLIAAGIERVRNKRVSIEPGYDGRFGRIRLFSDDERGEFASQVSDLMRLR